MGTNYIAPTWRMPRNANKDKLSNYSIDFAGSEYITCDVITQLGNKTQATWSGWFNRGVSSGSHYLMSSWGFSGTERQFLVLQTPTRLAVYMGLGQYGNQRTMFDSNSLTFTTGVWYHLMFVYNESEASNADKMKVYINNVVQTNESVGNAINFVNPVTSPFMIGTIGGYLTNKFQGQISQVSIFDYALSTDQRSYLYNLNNPMAISGAKPVAYWPLGDNSNPHITAGYPNISVGEDSVFNFDTSDSINTKTISEFGITGEFTVSMWLNATTLNGYATPLWASDSSFANGFGFYYNSSRFHFFVDHYITYGVVQTGTSTTNVWYHLVGTFSNSGTVKLYINGVANGTPKTGATLDGLNNTLVISKGAAVAGDITNVQLWNKELIDSEVATLYNNGQPLMTGTQPQAANLKAWYKLNQSANWSVDDGSTNWQIPDALSAYPKSLIFKETSDTVNINIANLNTTHSINYWIYMVGGGASQAYTLSSGSTNGWRVYCNQASLYYRPTGSNTYMIYNTMPYNLLHNPGWHNITITRSGDTVKFYMNGNSTPFYTHTYTNAPALDTLTHISGDVASPYPGNGADVTYSNFIFTNTEISGSNVTELYNNGRPVTSLPSSIASDVVAWYKFDDTMVFYNNTGQWGIPNSASTNNQIINFSN